ncbi:sensor histidine kinase [Massilia consociata]|uniref:histidine kinase n=1 Tax=Massilia consociata TaxID=760117 RepID=A0ABV6F9T0_9BURK
MNFPSRSALPLFTACACAVIALACLSGWASGIEHLTSVFRGFPAMVPMTAGMTLLACCALVLRQSGAGKHAGLLPALALMAAALMILLAYAVQPLGWLPDLMAGRGGWRLSSPITAAAFLVLGASLGALPYPRHVHRSQWLALGVLFLALLTLAGYLFRDTFLYHSLPGTGTSILTVVALILLSIGSLATRFSEGIMAAVTGHAPSAQIARRLLLAAIILPVLLGTIIWIALHFDAVDIDTGIALLVWGIAVLIIVVTWHGAVRLNRADVARREAERALEDALASLREADAHKDHFLAVLGHELRNPLAPIRAAADLLRLPSGVDASQQRRTGDIIARQVEAMTHLVDDLLDMSRVRQGLMTTERVPVDLSMVVNDALEQARPAIAQRRHGLATELPDRHPVVLGDHKRLVQVVANLLANAAKYTPEGGRIVLALHAGPHQARIEVSDNGIGIEAALLEHVFDSFAQVTRSPGRTGGGLGIGLALVKSLVELHGGSVAAHSAGLGQGSTFQVTLPLVQQDPERKP